VSVHFTHLQVGADFAVLYRFDQRGEGIPMHAHAHELEHTVTCTRGTVELYGPGRAWRQVLRMGETCSLFDSTKPHEIAALEDHSSVLNTFLHGRPPAYVDLPPHEIDGSLEMQLTEPSERT
jgi:hypothetical protein